MTKRRAIAWRVGRALVCGLVLTIAMTRVDDAIRICGSIVAIENHVAECEEGALHRARGRFADTIVCVHDPFTPPPSVRALANQAGTAHWREYMYRISDGPFQDSIGVGVTQVHQGWPMRAFAGRVDDASGTPSYAWKWAMGQHAVVISLLPLWPGLLVNVAFFAVATAAIEVAVRAVRSMVRSMRRRAGHCGVCGYSRTGLTEEHACPECGEVSAWSRSAAPSVLAAKE